MTKQEYQNLLKAAFASEYAFYLKAQNFHWNVEGPNFPQYHELFGKIYEEVGGIIDAFAENLRKSQIYAPADFLSLSQLTKVAGEDSVLTAQAMLQELLMDSDLMAEMFDTVFEAAEAEHEHGLSNFFADRQDQHRKHSWMLRSTLK